MKENWDLLLKSLIRIVNANSVPTPKTVVSLEVAAAGWETFWKGVTEFAYGPWEAKRFNHKCIVAPTKKKNTARPRPGLHVTPAYGIKPEDSVLQVLVDKGAARRMTSSNLRNCSHPCLRPQAKLIQNVTVGKKTNASPNQGLKAQS